MRSKSKLVRAITVVVAVLFTALLAVGATGAWMLFAPNFMPEKTCRIYIYPENDFRWLCRQLEDSARCRNLGTFIRLAGLLNYPDHMYTGCYAVEPGMNNRDLLNRLRRGHQERVRITFNSIRTKEDLAERLSAQLMMDGDGLAGLLDDETFCDSMGFTLQTVPAMFIPNTYEVYWNISPVNLMRRMKREYLAFWTETRRERAEKAGLSPVEVATLASIVEEESAAVEEYPVIAGLYINRLHRGMLLQADPTVKYAVGDFGLRRVLNWHRDVESPYNTYLHEGLPPGPIRIPSITAIDAVLNCTKHHYLYMCAKEDLSGRHHFTASLAEHNRHAAHYHAALNRLGIR
ncbi:MAG: endolytic transglycosylase MltG [Tannerella sp.]|jgi:UPF0755 protein|nr:endolytic transglycosylase MltG [Tannerella sp.]